MRTVRTLLDPTGKRRVRIVERDDGTFVATPEHWYETHWEDSWWRAVGGACRPGMHTMHQLKSQIGRHGWNMIGPAYHNPKSTCTSARTWAIVRLLRVGEAHDAPPPN